MSMVMNGNRTTKIDEFESVLSHHDFFCSHSPDRFTEDIYQMTGYRPGIYWQWTWRYIGPVIMSLILVASLIKMIINTPTYSAWVAEEVMFTHFLIRIEFAFNNFLTLGSNRNASIPELGHGHSCYNDHCRYTTNANCILFETLPDLEGGS